MSLFAQVYTRRVVRRGGIRQRAAAAADDAGEDPPKVSKLAVGLLQDWADGNLSAAQVQRHASNAIADGMSDPLLQRLQQDSNPQRGLQTLLRDIGVLGFMSTIDGSNCWRQCVLPSTWLRHIQVNSPRDFRLAVGANIARTREFWEEFLRTPDRRAWAAQHAFLRDKSVEDLLHTIPLALHEDSGPCSKKQSANCITFTSLLKSGPEKITHFLCATALKGKTDDLKVWEVLLQDFEELARDGLRTGRGETWSFVLLVIQADEEVRANSFGLIHWGQGDDICPECLANRTTMPYTDLRPNAAWRSHLVSDLAEFRGRNRRPNHPLLASPFFTRHLLQMDVMHCMDCKGVAAIAYGSFLMYVIGDLRLGANQGERIDRFNTEMNTWYAARPGSNRLPAIKLSDIRKLGWGELHSPAIKAAMTREAAPFFCDLAERLYSAAPTPQEASTIQLLRELKAFYEVLASQGMFMSPASVRRLRLVCERFGTAFMSLREAARMDNMLAWQVTTKVHKMQHMPTMAKLMNPRAISCYAFESAIGTTTTVWKRSLNGRHQQVNQGHVLAKRVLGVLLRWEV